MLLHPQHTNSLRRISSDVSNTAHLALELHRHPSGTTGQPQHLAALPGRAFSLEDPMDTDEMGVGLEPQTGKPQKTEDLLSGNLT